MILTCFVTMIHDSATPPDSGTRQDDLLNSALIRPGFLFNKNWIPDFNHYLDSTTRLRSGGNCKGDLAAWSRKKTTGRMSLPLSRFPLDSGVQSPGFWVTGNNFPDSGIHSSSHGAINFIFHWAWLVCISLNKYWFFVAPSHFFQNGMFAQN